MPTTPISGLRFPALSDTPNVPLHMSNLASDLDDKVYQPVANMTAVSALASGDGRMAYDKATNRWLYNDGANWIKYAGPRETVYENGNQGSSGLVAAGGTAVVLNGTFSVPVAADTGHVEITVAPTVSTSTAIVWTLTVNGVGHSQVQDGALTGAPLTFGVPVSLPSGAVEWFLTLAPTGGNASLRYSGLRCFI